MVDNKKEETANETHIINRVLVLGNGFDLAVGRRTTYKDFYDSKYCPKNYPAPLINYLNGKWGDNLENVRWLDLETALQEYAENPSKEDYYNKAEESAITTFFNGNMPQNMYLYNQIIGILDKENRLPSKEDREFYKLYFGKSKERREEDALKKIEQGLSDYLLSEGENKYWKQDTKAIELLKEYLKDDYSSIYSFNYTHVENLVSSENEKINVYDAKFHYMHGSLSCGHVIIGAKDGKYGDYDFIQKSFDEEYKSSTLLDDMKKADEVVIYGHSLGDCDSQYFKRFFNDLVSEQRERNKKKKKITIYTYDKNSEIQIKKNLNMLTDYRLSWLYSSCDVEIIKSK